MMLLKVKHDTGEDVRSLKDWLHVVADEPRIVTLLKDLDKKRERVEIVTVEDVISSYNRFYRELRPR